MMSSKTIKYIFWVLSALLLIFMLLASRDAGINCDEVLHYNHSQAVYKYFASSGADRSALNTPVTNLKYYGQSFDNLVTVIINWFGIDDVYSFRHIMSTFAGWITILITALFAIWLSGYGAGILVLLLYFVSPTFIGHTQNNLKDIPFALSYIAGIFCILKLFSGNRISIGGIMLLIISIAFGISIRAGGLLLICYSFLFFLVYFLYDYFITSDLDLRRFFRVVIILIMSGISAWMLGILLWPFALQSPLKNVIESYGVMAHFPDTFRQIFEGKNEWSDFMPWYYLPKSMAITIPFIVLAGLLLFLLFSRRIFKDGKGLHFTLLIFTILFPMFFVVYAQSNLYSSWRQFLFLYPVIVLVSATGYYYLFKVLNNKYLYLIPVVLFAALSVHPLMFMAKNHSFFYIYYNQFTGGLKGAYSNYETDYYYVSQTEASEWLIDYLAKNKSVGPVKVKATYSVNWLFRKHTEIETSYFRFEERSMYDWDYAIVVNRYIPLFKLRNNLWPPKNSIHTIYADGVPVCAILKRETKDDYYGYKALNEGRNEDAIKFFEKVLKSDDSDEMIFYNFAAALYNTGNTQKADSLLKKALELNPDFEQVLMYLGNIARFNKRDDEAINYYERVIKANRKYFEAYAGLAELLTARDVRRARELLFDCLDINPDYKPAVEALADTYRESDPDIAAKYDEMAKAIK
jgi:tetratricopeptide (TPR) repeat protein